MSYFPIAGTGVLIAFTIHASYSLFLHDGSLGPYPMAVQILVGAFILAGHFLGLGSSIATGLLCRYRAF